MDRGWEMMYDIARLQISGVLQAQAGKIVVEWLRFWFHSVQLLPWLAAETSTIPSACQHARNTVVALSRVVYLSFERSKTQQNAWDKTHQLQYSVKTFWERDKLAPSSTYPLGCPPLLMEATRRQSSLQGSDKRRDESGLQSDQ